MSVLPILMWPDASLSVACEPIETVTEDLRDLAKDMLDTMYAAPGRGLAAPQVGVLRRIFVMDAGWKTGAPTPMVCINPEVTPIGIDLAVTEEGCLSIPDLLVKISRPVRVGLQWTDLNGKRKSAEFDGFEAVCVQHEVDHLDGRVMFDRLPTSDREVALRSFGSAMT